MIRRFRKHAATIAAATGLAFSSVAPAVVKTMQTPPDTVVLTPSALPGYAKAQAQCSSCHSAEYLLYQPPNASRAYWDAMVHRMKAVFHAPVADSDMPDIVDYLAATYGNHGSK